MKREEPARFADFVERAKAVPHGEGRYFELIGPTGKRSFLFGTAHISDPRALAWVDQIRGDIAGSAVIALENTDLFGAVINPAVALKALSFMLGKPGQAMEDFLTPAEAESVAEAIAPTMGLPPAAIRKFKPTVLSFLTGLSPCEQKRARATTIVDKKIFTLGIEAGIKTTGLETIEQMFAALDEAPYDLSARRLVERLNARGGGEDQMETMLVALDAGRVGLLHILMREFLRTGREAPERLRTFMQAMVERRNAAMFENALRLANEGNAFIAVGVLHLPGEEGMVALFERAGFRIIPRSLTRTTTDE